jgi:hypothetical protein
MDSLSELESESVEEVHKESSSDSGEYRRRSGHCRQQDLSGRFTRTKSSSLNDIDGASQGEEGHDGAVLITEISASRSILIVMVVVL